MFQGIPKAGCFPEAHKQVRHAVWSKVYTVVKGAVLHINTEHNVYPRLWVHVVGVACVCVCQKNQNRMLGEYKKARESEEEEREEV